MSAPDEIWIAPDISNKWFVRDIDRCIRYIRAPESAAQPTVGRLDQSVGQPTASPAHLPESAARNALADALAPYLKALDDYVDGWASLAIEYRIPARAYADHAKHMADAVASVRRIIALRAPEGAVPRGEPDVDERR